MKFKRVILVSSLTLSMMSLSNVHVSASEMSITNVYTTNQLISSNDIEANASKFDVDIIKLNDSMLQIDIINENVKIAFNESGEVTLSNNDKSEVLPTYAFDKNNEYVKLVYKKTDIGLIVELHKNEIMSYSRSKKSKWKCALGTLGGYYSGAVIGGTSGAAAGSIIPGLGTVAGGVGGAIFGAIGGGMTGAATFCFD
ncbi:Pathogenicity island protein [Lysinibacillus mangiferihumi]|uniref:Pathogenicity island protein n=1 Tax=Lysinibacillus mangiferihumi TaxID=1130819 RepID=A0A4U2Z999_9BACI|nr:Pathogenicity island protein [Lysinibacillus mangiferihumi]TKI70090.1 Pathogenicity island protein [Lysinibacillus mangiferihumi]